MTHSLFSFLLLFEQLALAAHITSVAFGRYVLAHLLDGLTGDDFGADCSLNRDVELLARNQVLEFHAHLASQVVGIIFVDEGRKGIGRLSVEQYVQTHQLCRTEVRQVVIERCIALGNSLELVVEVKDYGRKRHIVVQLDAVGGDVVLADERAATVEAELHYRPEELRFGDDLSTDVRLLDMVYESR